jgi:hypothetical protein
MKNLIVVFIICLSLACNSSITYEKGFYERIAKIKIPNSFKAIASFDNADGLTITTFKVEHGDLLNFIKTNKLVTNQKGDSNGSFKSFFRSSYLKGDKPIIDSRNTYYLIGDNSTSKQNPKNLWIFVADIKRNLLWIEIVYPGLADGN